MRNDSKIRHIFRSGWDALRVLLLYVVSAVCLYGAYHATDKVDRLTWFSFVWGVALVLRFEYLDARIDRLLKEQREDLH